MDGYGFELLGKIHFPKGCIVLYDSSSAFRIRGSPNSI